MIRLVLALCVLVSHISNIEIGRIAVLIFFFLSGYWVLDAWRRKFGPRLLLVFYLSRYLRVAPLYVVGICSIAVITRSDLVSTNVLLFGMANAAVDPLWVSWSLDLELQFYILLPILAALVAYDAVALLLVTALTSTLGWVVYSKTHTVEILQYLPAFVLGMLTRQYRWAPGRAGALASLAAFAALTIVLACSDVAAAFLLKDRPHLIHRDLFSFLWMLPLLPYVAHVTARPSTALDRHLGNLSYALYIAHPVALTFLALVVPNKSVLIGAACLGFVVLAAGALYVLVDRPLERARARLEDRLIRLVAPPEGALPSDAAVAAPRAVPCARGSRAEAGRGRVRRRAPDPETRRQSR